jgi:hypothetical protein
LTHDGVALLTLDVSHKAHATGVVFVRGVVQTLSLQVCFVGSRGHRAFLKKISGTRRILHCSIHAKKINWGQNPINCLLILVII